VAGLPPCKVFKPAGIPACSLEEVILAVDELEAVRLADLRGLYQEQAAQEMNISRQTFGRIIESAHRKVAEALVEGKALRIEGGEIEMAGMRTFKCRDCQHTWGLPFGAGRPQECPKCKGLNIHRAPEDRFAGRDRGGCGGRGRCHRGGRSPSGPKPEAPPETKK
jgi:predicted DNA-binding protein (UPF0251 family)/phage FluMu protein Com